MNYDIVLDTENFAEACDIILELHGHINDEDRPAMVRCEYPYSDNGVVLRISAWNPLIEDHHYLVDNMSDLLALVFRLKYSGMPYTRMTAVPDTAKEPSSGNEDKPFRKRHATAVEVKAYREATGAPLMGAVREVRRRIFSEEFAAWRKAASTTGKLEYILDWIAEQETK